MNQHLTHTVSGVVKRILLEPLPAKKGGYRYRSLEIASEGAPGRVFVNISETLREEGRGDLSRFPELCRPGVEICGRNLLMNNELDDGTRLYTATPSSWLLLDPGRLVSVTDASVAAICLRRADIASRAPIQEPYWAAVGVLVHELFSSLTTSLRVATAPDFDVAYDAAARGIIPRLSGSHYPFDQKTLREEAEGHHRRLAAWIERNKRRFCDAFLELDVVSPIWGLKGRVDALFRGPDGMMVFELKSGRRASAEHLLQLTAYTLALQDEDGQFPEGILFYSRNGMEKRLINRDIAKALEGRNRIIALRNWHAQSPGSEAPWPPGMYTTCPESGNCLQRTLCEYLYGKDLSVGIGFHDHPQRDYYEKWFHLLSQDDQASDKGAENESGSAVERTVAALEPGSRAGAAILVLHSEDGSPEIAPFERVLVRQCGDASRIGLTGTIIGVADDEIRVEVGAPLSLGGGPCSDSGGEPLFPVGSRAFLELIPFPGGSARRRALYFFLTKGSNSVVEAVTGHGPARLECKPDHVRISGGLGPQDDGGDSGGREAFETGLSGELNEDQEAALQIALRRPPLHLIHGPPGTGKTRLLSRLIRKCLDGGERVLVAAPTHTALDGLLAATLRLGPTRFLRLGPRAKASDELKAVIAGLGGRPCFLEDVWDSAHSAADFLGTVDRTPLVAATAHACASHAFFLRHEFDLVVIDEAGQLLEPLTVGAISHASRVTLCGDHLQLPPIVRNAPGGDKLDKSLHCSLFERLALSDCAAPLTRLRVQYRMNRQIQDISSRLFYGGELEPAPEVATRRLPIRRITTPPKLTDWCIQGEPPALFVDVGSNEGTDRGAREAKITEDIVRALLAAGIPAGEVGVITPYKAQQRAIRERLKSPGGASGDLVSIDTVERFQGGEREVIIFSPAPRSGVTSFLGDPRRLNVSLTRAKSKLILLGDAALLEKDPLFKAVLEGTHRVTAD